MSLRVRVFSHPYFSPALFAIALVSISINLVSHRRTAEDERSRVQAQISVLESIKEQLQAGKPLSVEELDRQRKLARSVDNDRERLSAVSWTEVFRSAKKSEGESELNKWEQQDLETIQKEISSSR